MKMFAQIDDDGAVVQFVGFNTNANAVPHCQAFSAHAFVPTDDHGDPDEFVYDPATHEVRRVDPLAE